MTIKLTDEQKKRILRQKKCSPIYKLLNSIKDIQFQVGDLLIEKAAMYDTDHTTIIGYRTVKAGSATNMPKRYIVMDVDKKDIPFVSSVSPNGKISNVVTYLPELVLEKGITLAHDQTYLDEIVLMGDSDPIAIIKKEYKEAQLVKRKNMAEAIKIKTVEHANEILNKLKVGDSIWVARAVTAAHHNDDMETVGLIVKHQRSTITPCRHDSKSFYAPRCNCSYLQWEAAKPIYNECDYIFEYRLNTKTYKSTYSLFSRNLIDYYVWLEPPYSARFL
jgi:hypothetical protein